MLLVPPAGAVEQRPHVAVTDDNPVVVAGRGFLRGERVTLKTAVNGERYTARVTANRLGRFTIRLADVDAQCWPFVVRAEGQRGSRAAARRIAIPPACGIVVQP